MQKIKYILYGIGLTIIIACGFWILILGLTI